MAHSQLRVYYGPRESDSGVAVAESREARSMVKVPLGAILPVLADAVRTRRTWLGDFKHDEVTISTDLYEVILAYQHYRRPSA